MIRAVFLDLDTTLLDYGVSAWQVTVRNVCAELSRLAADLDTESLGDAYMRRYLDHMPVGGRGGPLQTGRIPDALPVWRELWWQALNECGSSHLIDHAIDSYVRQRRLHYTLFDDVAETLRTLRRFSYRLALVTNGPGDAQRDKIKATGLDAFLDAIVISGEVAVAKPDRRIFDVALRLVGLRPAEVCHVGDSLAVDIVGAHNAGLGAAIWLNRTKDPGDPQVPPSHEIGSLRELPALLRTGKSIRTES